MANLVNRLGIDLGNVIIDHVGFGTTDEYFAIGDYNAIPPVPGMFNALSFLNRSRFFGNIFVIYNASDIADEKICNWLTYHNFYERAGIPANKVMRSKNGRNKANECIALGVTHFVDDRLEVLGHLIGAVKKLHLFRPHNGELNDYKQFISNVTISRSWNQLATRLIAS